MDNSVAAIYDSIMVTRALLVLGAFLLLGGFTWPSLGLIGAGGVCLTLALLWALIEVVAPLR